jgi:hypothetical protein
MEVSHNPQPVVTRRPTFREALGEAVCFIHSCHLPSTGTKMLESLVACVRRHLGPQVPIRVVNVGLSLPADLFARDGRLTVTHASDEPGAFELPTLRAVHAFATGAPQSAILYMHTKGITYKAGTKIHACVQDWIALMLYFLVERAQDYLPILHDVAGCNYRTHPVPHYSGNFWWARGAYIAKLTPPPPTANKMDAEWWLLASNPAVGKAARRRDLFQSPLNHYKERCPRITYETLDAPDIAAICMACLLAVVIVVFAAVFAITDPANPGRHWESDLARGPPPGLEEAL